MENKKYSVVSMHPYTSCDMNCVFCYKAKSNPKDEKPESFWLDMIPYVKQLSNQIALGGGEPFMNVKFINKMAKKSAENEVLFNITTNGKKLMAMADGELRSALENVTMVSISYDDYKIQSKLDHDNYMALVKRIKNLTNCQVGSNLLVNNKDFEKHGKPMFDTVELLFKGGVDRVFALHPKNMAGAPKILDFKAVYTMLTMKFKHFYVDDLTKQIIQEGSYGNWKNACHYGKDLISINELGYVGGCSFDSNDKAIFKIEKPSDLLKVAQIKTVDRFDCPYLVK